MRKILMYTTNKIYTGDRITGGIKRFMMLYDGLINRKYDVDLYCGESEETLKKINPNAKSLNCGKSKNNTFANFIIMVKNLKLLIRLKKERYDNIIVFDVPTAISLCLLKFKKVNLFLRQDLIEYRKIILSSKRRNKVYTLFYLKFMKFCEYICCKNSEKIIVQCKFDLDNLIKRHRLIRKDIYEKTVIQINNINAPWIVEKSKVTSNGNNKNNKFKIGFIGDFSNIRKGHSILLPAIQNIIDDKIEIETYIIGDGKELNEYKEVYKEYKNIKFLGKLENPIKILKNMDLMVVPSLADSCPNTVLESMYNDILVIGSNTGGIPEILINEEALFPLKPDELKDKIIRIIKDNDYKQELEKRQILRKKELIFNWNEKIINILKR